MEIKSTLYRFFIIMTLSAAFWYVYYVAYQSVPVVSQLSIINGTKLNLPFAISRLWDIFAGAVWLTGLSLLFRSNYLGKHLLRIKSLRDYFLLLIIFLCLEFIYTEEGQLFGILVNGFIVFVCSFVIMLKETKNTETSLILSNVFISNLVGGVVFYYYGAVVGLAVTVTIYLISYLFYYFIINLSQAYSQKPIW